MVVVVVAVVVAVVVVVVVVVMMMTHCLHAACFDFMKQQNRIHRDSPGVPKTISLQEKITTAATWDQLLQTHYQTLSPAYLIQGVSKDQGNFKQDSERSTCGTRVSNGDGF